MRTSVRGIVIAVALLATSNCKFFEKKVPADIVQKAFEQSLRHASATTSAMCGAETKGFATSAVSIKSTGENNTGVVHVVGKPWMAKGVPATCEGDFEYAFSYKTKTFGPRKRRRTETTWSLDKMRLSAVQTAGVTFKGAQDEPSHDDDDDDDDDKTGEKASDKAK